MHVRARRLGAGLIATAAFGAAALGLAGCGGSSDDDAAATTAAPATTAAATTAAGSSVDVTLGKPQELAMTVTGSPASGDVTFHVSNAGSVVHEMVVITTATPAAKLPVKDGEASEDGSVGEVADLEAGGSEDLTVNLPAGHYALICNLPGHYAGGMYADLTVE